MKEQVMKLEYDNEGFPIFPKDFVIPEVPNEFKLKINPKQKNNEFSVNISQNNNIPNDSLLHNLKQEYDTNGLHLFINNKLVFLEPTTPVMKKKIKKSFPAPESDVKCDVITMSIDEKYKFPIMINCIQKTITPKLSYVSKDDDESQTITFTNAELKQYGFKKEYFIDIINALREGNISLEKSSVPFSDIVKTPKKNIEKLVEADALHLKHHPSPDDAMELQEDKNKLRLIKYIDTKWFNPDNLKERKIKLLKNRVIKKINSGEFLHKKEVNKYIKDYYAKK